jgi:hypothetical protein
MWARAAACAVLWAEHRQRAAVFTVSADLANWHRAVGVRVTSLHSPLLHVVCRVIVKS